MIEQKTAFIAIVGCPNVGKSSILNHLLGEKIAIVSVPDKKVKGETVILDDRLLLAPSFAIAECYRQSIKMAEMVEFNFINSTKMLKSYHKKKAEQIRSTEAQIDNFRLEDWYIPQERYRCAVSDRAAVRSHRAIPSPGDW